MTTDAKSTAGIDAKVRSAIAETLDRHLGAVTDKTRLLVVEELQNHWKQQIEDRVRALVNEQGTSWWAIAKPQVETTVEAKLLAHIQQERERRLRKWALPVVAAIVGAFVAMSGFVGWAVKREIDVHVQPEAEKAAKKAAAGVHEETDKLLADATSASKDAKLTKKSYDELLAKADKSILNAEKSEADWKKTEDEMQLLLQSAKADKREMDSLARSNLDDVTGLLKSLQAALAPNTKDLIGKYRSKLFLTWALDIFGKVRKSNGFRLKTSP